MMNAPVPANSLTTGAKAPPALREIAMSEIGGGAMLRPGSFGEVVAFAEMMARGGVAIRKHLRDKPGACMAITMQALRWEMDPFAVANKSFEVNDQIAYESQLIAAVVIVRAPIVGRPSYSFEGQADDMVCTVSCTMRDGAVLSYTSPRIGKIHPKNSPLWKTDPQQQLGYYSIRSWARRHTPEVILGVYDPEEPQAAEPIRQPERLPAGEKLAGRLAGPGGGGFSEAHVQRETGQTIEGQVVTFDDNLKQFAQIVAATTTAADLDALGSRTTNEAWYRNADEADVQRALDIFTARMDVLRTAEAKAKEPETVAEETHEATAAGTNTAASETASAASETDSEDSETTEETPEQKLLSEARAVATNGVRKLKLWWGRLNVELAATMEPHKAALMKAAQDADAAL